MLRPQTIWAENKKVPNVNILQMIDTIITVLVSFSTKTKQEVPEGFQSLKASIEQATETEIFCRWSKPQKLTLACKCYETLSLSIYRKQLKSLKCLRSLPPLNAPIKPETKTETTTIQGSRAYQKLTCSGGKRCKWFATKSITFELFLKGILVRLLLEKTSHF